MKSNKLVAVGIIAGVILTALVPTFANRLHDAKEVKSISGESVVAVISEEDSRFLVADMKLPLNTYILDEKREDVTGDGVNDTIYLIGQKRDKADRFANKLNIVVCNGATNDRKITDIKTIGGYEGNLFIGDFSGDKVKDVMITAPTGGSGGIVQHIIVTFNASEPIVIFDQTNNAGAKFTGKFVDDFKAELVNENTGRSINIDLNAKKEMYVTAQIYNKDGTLLKEVKPMTYPLSLLEPIDMDGDSTYELKGSQQIKGAYGADTISHVYSFWKFENNQWTAKQIEVSSFLLTLNETRHVPNSIPKHSNDIDRYADITVISEADNNREITVQSGNEIQIKLKENGSTGYKWSLENLDNNYFEIINEKNETIQNDVKLVGAPYTKVFSLRVKQAGTAEIKLNNFRAWESKDMLVKTFAIKVNIE